jgi:hypothetical protein
VHWEAVKRILRYVKGTLNLGLQIVKSRSTVVNIFADADCAGCPTINRGFCCVLWVKSYILECEETGDGLYIEYRNRIQDLGQCYNRSYVDIKVATRIKVPTPRSAQLWCYNIAAMYLTSNPVFHAWMKHKEVDYYFCERKGCTEAS